MDNFEGFNRDSATRKYWFVYTVVGDQIIVDGVWNSDREARTFGHRTIPMRYNIKVYGSNNKDRSEAIKAIRHLVLDEQANLEAIMQRARHLGEK